MTGIAARSEIADNDIDIQSIALPPNARDLAYWLDDIEFRKARGILAWPATIGRVEGFNEMGSCLAQGIAAHPDRLRKAWTNAWPEHLAHDDASIHDFDKVRGENDQVNYRFHLSAYKVRPHLLGKKYIVFIQIFFPDGKMPLGFAPAKTLGYAIGRANLVMSGNEVPYRSVRAALSDNEM
jgi:hypothetical protein